MGKSPDIMSDESESKSTEKQKSPKKLGEIEKVREKIKKLRSPEIKTKSDDEDINNEGQVKLSNNVMSSDEVKREVKLKKEEQPMKRKENNQTNEPFVSDSDLSSVDENTDLKAKKHDKPIKKKQPKQIKSDAHI